MQDLKHLSRKRRFSGFGSVNHDNRRLKSAAGRSASSRILPVLTEKRRQQLKYSLLFLAVVLALTPVSLLIFQKMPHVVKTAMSWLAARSAVPPKAAEAAKPLPASSFENACGLLGTAAFLGDGRLTAQAADGCTVLYTIKGGLQKRVHDFMAAKQVPYGVFVAIEPSTGRILAMTAYSSVDPQWAQSAFFNLYPMASLFKIITASAALESKKITPQTVIEFRGNSYSENPRYWSANPKGRNNKMDLTYAMGKSVNPVYGRVASEIAGKASVMESVQKFGFNQTILPGIPVKESKAGEPETHLGLMLMGAGLDHEVKISPMHAAVMMAAIANGGRMMSPGLTEKIIDAKGAEKEVYASQEVRRFVSPETAASLTRMLSTTVVSGTSRHAFHDRKGRPTLGNVEVAAKTGSINGVEPRGHYSWFAAYAPAASPRIALVALIINQDKWKIKSAQVGEQALAEFFGK